MLPPPRAPGGAGPAWASVRVPRRRPRWRPAWWRAAASGPDGAAGPAARDAPDRAERPGWVAASSVVISAPFEPSPAFWPRRGPGRGAGSADRPAVATRGRWGRAIGGRAAPARRVRRPGSPGWSEGAAVYDGILAETIRFEGHGGDEIPGVPGPAAGDGPLPGVVVIHHMPGYDARRRRSPAPSPCTATGHLPEPALPGRPRRRSRARRRRGREARAGCPTSAASATWRARRTALRTFPACNAQGRRHRLLLGWAAGLPGARAGSASSTRRWTATAAGSWPRPDELAERQPVAPIDLTPACRPRSSGSSAPRTRTRHLSRSPPSTTRSPSTASRTSSTPTPRPGHAFFSVDRPIYNVEAVQDGWQRDLGVLRRPPGRLSRPGGPDGRVACAPGRPGTRGARRASRRGAHAGLVLTC